LAGAPVRPDNEARGVSISSKGGGSNGLQL
jgi:hypothetical protein